MAKLLEGNLGHMIRTVNFGWKGVHMFRVMGIERMLVLELESASS